VTISSHSSSSISLSSLSVFLEKEIQKGKEGETALLSGHFAVFSAGATPQDYLGVENPPEIARSMVSFTKTTWVASCTALARASTSKAKMVLLVDDVAFLRPKLADRRAAEKLAAALSDIYLAKLNPIPGYHLETMQQHELSIDCLLPTSSGGLVFSERELRSELIHSLRADLVRSHTEVHYSENDTSVSIQMGEGSYQLAYSGNTNCVGAYLELHRRLIDVGIKKVIAIVPSRCFGPLCTGTAIAPLIGFNGCEIVTVSVPEPGVGDVVLVSRGGK